MSNIEFLKLDLTPTEKHLGIATVRYEKRFIFRFKVIPKEKGGFWIQPASHKVSSNGKDQYLVSFQLDSFYEDDEIKKFIVEHVENILISTQKELEANQGKLLKCPTMFDQYRQDLPFSSTPLPPMPPSPPLDDGLPF